MSVESNREAVASTPVAARDRQGGGMVEAGEPARSENVKDDEKSRLMTWLGRNRGYVQGGADGFAWATALLFATQLRYDFQATYKDLDGLFVLIPVAIAVQALAGVGFGIYTGRSRFGSFEEVTSLVKACGLTVLFLVGFNPMYDPQLAPLSVPFIAGLLALVEMSAIRYCWRLWLERKRVPPGEDCHRLLLFGAGDGAVQVISALLRDPDNTYVPVGLLDDQITKRNLRIRGVPVLGRRQNLAEVAEATNADTLLIAIPSADNKLVTDITELGRAAGLDVKVLPPVRDLFEGQIEVDDIRDVTTADLLGRHEIHTDVPAIAGYISGKRVLVTGAGGSIGSELCRQLYRFAPAQLVMLDRDESALHGVQLGIEGRALLDSPDLVLVDLRDRAAVAQALERYRPEVVFHAAALKHLTLLERHPAEAVKTNVWATLDLLELSEAAGVSRFVNISTDKAADPCSVLGYTKRITERLTSHFSSTAGAFLSVRFGNVLGSRGSVLTTFHSQVERGGPLTVTHKDVTRYFMTVEEAVELVIQAGAIGRPGEVLVLDMGKPVSIDELATLVAGASKRPPKIEYTGLRPGEKLHEVLLGADEIDLRPSHELISQVDVPPLDPARSRAIDVTCSHDEIIRSLQHLCALKIVDA